VVIAPIYAKPPTVDDVAGKLSCYCGNCPHLVVNRCGCSIADQIKGDIKKMIDQGMTEDQIIKSYVAQYGETVLAAPPKKGFQLTAWAIPFVAFIVGGLVLIAFLKRQQEKSQEIPPTTPEPTEQAKDEHYRKLLNDELEKRK
jgi:cytochrome c-type biogenesis protein CcmH